MPSGTKEDPEAEDHGKHESSPSTLDTSPLAEDRDDTGTGERPGAFESEVPPEVRELRVIV